MALYVLSPDICRGVAQAAYVYSDELSETKMEEKSMIAVISKYRKAIMGFAALWILAMHEWRLLIPYGESFWEREVFLKDIGFCGVDIFLLLSGMGLTYAIKKSSVGRFYFGRIKRILFPYLAVAVIVGVSYGWSAREFLANVSGYNFYFKSIYSFMWFVPAILTLYLVFPLYWAIFSRAKNKTVFTLTVLVIWLLVSMVLRDRLRGDMYGFTNRIPVFLVGVLYGWLCQNNRMRESRGLWALTALTLLLGLYLADRTNVDGMYLLVPVSNCCVPNLLIAMSLPLIMAKLLDLLASFRATRWLSAAANAVLGFFGMMSLEFYCIQQWVSEMISGYLDTHFGHKAINLLMLAAVTLAALVLYFGNKGFVAVLNALDRRLFPRTAAAKSAVSAVGTDNADASDTCVSAPPGDTAQASAVVSDAQKSSGDGSDASENADVADMPGSESSGAV